MKKLLLAVAVASAISTMTRKRAHTQDISFTYRMGAGFPGDVNRTHPFNVLPGQIDTTHPVGLYGDPVILDATSHMYRAFIAGDGAASPALNIAGVAVRPYPTQQTTGGLTATIGAAAVNLNQPLDVLSMGYIVVKCNNFGTNAPTKGGAVFIWCAATSGAHIQGGFEAAASSTNTVPVANAFWNGPTDAAGITEMSVGMLQL